MPPHPHGVTVGAVEGWLYGASPFDALMARGRGPRVGMPWGVGKAPEVGPSGPTWRIAMPTMAGALR